MQGRVRVDTTCLEAAALTLLCCSASGTLFVAAIVKLAGQVYRAELSWSLSRG